MPRSVKSTSEAGGSHPRSRRGRYRRRSPGDRGGVRHGGAGAVANNRPPLFFSRIVYWKTKAGQLLYDLAFTDLPDRYLAKKHHKPIAKIRKLRHTREIMGLRQQNGLKNYPLPLSQQ